MAIQSAETVETSLSALTEADSISDVDSDDGGIPDADTSTDLMLKGEDIAGSPNPDIKLYPAVSPSLVLSVAEDYVLSSIEFNRPFDIFAESVTLKGSVRASRHLGVFTHFLQVDGDKPYALSVAAKNAPALKQVSVESKPDAGNSAVRPGGALELVVEEANMSLFDLLELSAKGGDGSAGQDWVALKPSETANSVDYPAGGDGGDATDGGSISVVLGASFSKILRKLQSIQQLDLKSQQAFDAIRILLKDWRTLAKEDQEHLKFIEELDARLNGPKPNLLMGILLPILTFLDNRTTRLLTSASAKMDVQGGKYGTGGSGSQRRAANGRQGKPGPLPLTQFRSLDPLHLRGCTIPLAHPDQCAMLLNKAKCLYFVGDQDSIATCCDLLSRLQDRLLFLDGLDKADPIYRAYTAAQGRMHLLSATVKARSEEPLCIRQLRDVSVSVAALSSQIQKGLDYYGRSYKFVPRGSYQQYSTLTKEILESLKVTEDAYSDYTKQNHDSSVMKTSISKMRQESLTFISKAEKDIASVQSELPSIAITIASLSALVKPAGVRLQDTIRQQEKRIQDALSLEQISFSEVVEALTMVTDPPSAVSMTISIATNIRKRDTMVPNDAGEFIDKKLLIGKIKAVGATAESLVQALHARDDGGIEIEDPCATKLIAEKDALEELLSNYQELLGKANLASIKQLFKEYTGML